MKFFAFDRYRTQAGSALRGIGAHGSGLVARLTIRNCFQYRPLGTLTFLSHEQQERRDLFGAKRAGATWLRSFSEQESWIQLVRG
jgi:hypothetical protein